MKDVLYVTHRVPWPPDRGDRIRTYNIIRYLGKRCRLHVVSLAEEPASQKVITELEKHCASVRVVSIPKTRWLNAAFSFARGRSVTEGLFAAPQVKAVIDERTARISFDATLASSSGVARYLDHPRLRTARRWVDLIDVDSEKWVNYATASNPLMAQIYRREGQRLRQVEVELAESCDELTVVSDAEVDVFRSFSDAGTVTAVTNGVDLDYFARPDDFGEELKCVFVGVLNYKPNADGVVWFCNNVWPDVRRRFPKARFEVVGRSPGADVLALNEIDGVEVVGSVPDVRPYLWSASTVVAPLLIARGVQNKVLEAFAASRPVVSSPDALVGLAIDPDVHAIRATAPAHWSDSICELFTNQYRRSELGAAAREWVTAHHRWEVCLRDFGRMIDEPSVPSQISASLSSVGVS